MFRSRSISTALVAAYALLLVLNFAFAQLSLRSESRALPSQIFEEVQLPAATASRVLFLNYSTFAATIAWIAVNVNLGASRWIGRKLDRLHENAATIQQLDPRFYRLYEWFAASWAFGNQPMEVQDARVVEEFLRRGMETYPRDTHLPFSAAMTYVGLSDADDDARIDRYRRIVALMEEATQGDDVHPDNYFVLANFRRRLHNLEQGDRASAADEREFYEWLYMTTINPDIRRRITGRIEALGGPSLHIANQMQAEREIAVLRDRTRPYLPLDLFLFLN